MKKILFSIVYILLLPACSSTPTTQISAFGDATEAITKKVDAVFDEYNDAALTRQYTDYAATYNGQQVKHLNINELAKIKRPITANQKKLFAVYRANKAVGSYAKALSTLATANTRSDIDLAVANLYGSMTILNDQYIVLKDIDLFDGSNLSSISKLIAAIGDAIVEKKRREAIKEIIIQADPNISLICDEINLQLKTAGIEDAISYSRKYILSEELIDYKSRINKVSTLDKRRNEIKRLHQLQQSIINSKLLVQQTQKAVIAIKKAHSILAASLKDNKFTSRSVSQAIGRLKEFEQHYDDFENIIINCNKISRNKDGILSCDDK